MKRFRLITRLLDGLGLSAPLAGDLTEEYERTGSTRWLWKQALTAFVLRLTARRAFGLLVAGFVVWLGLMATQAWVRSPALVAELEKQGALELEATDLSDWQTCALIAIQDPEFHTHWGVGLFHGRFGHVTISQGVAKRLFGYRPGLLYRDKYRAMAMSLAINSRFSKSDQLRIFLNRAYLGAVDQEQIIGFAAASRTYFGREFDAVTERQFLALIAMLFNPTAFNVATHPDQNAAQVPWLRAIAERHCSDASLVAQSQVRADLRSDDATRRSRTRPW